MQKSWKIGLLLVLMFLTAIPTFLFLASVLLLIALFFRVFGPVYGLHIIPEGYYLLPLSGLCTIIFFASLVMFIKTIKSIKENNVIAEPKELSRIVKRQRIPP